MSTSIFYAMSVDQVQRAEHRLALIFARMDKSLPHDSMMKDIDNAIMWLNEQEYVFDTEAWLASSDDEFKFDYANILRNVCPITGELYGDFIPRFALSIEAIQKQWPEGDLHLQGDLFEGDLH
jgi:hypothetical protein